MEAAMANSESNAASPMQFIVQGEPVKTGRLAEHLKREPNVKQIARVAPDVVILSMTPAQANRLKSAFATIIVEPNSTLNQFNKN
jgi:ABC-type Fe3+-hydroxamate transport system substrate-binding protein